MAKWTSTNMFFKDVYPVSSMKVESRSTLVFLAATFILYIYDRGLLALFAVVLALLLLLLDLDFD